MRVFSRRGIIVAASLVWFGIVAPGIVAPGIVAPGIVAAARAQPPDGPFAEMFAQLAGRIVGVVVNISTQGAPPIAKSGQDAPQNSPGSTLDEVFRDLFWALVNSKEFMLRR